MAIRATTPLYSKVFCWTTSFATVKNEINYLEQILPLLYPSDARHLLDKAKDRVEKLKSCNYPRDIESQSKDIHHLYEKINKVQASLQHLEIGSSRD